MGMGGGKLWTEEWFNKEFTVILIDDHQNWEDFMNAVITSAKRKYKSTTHKS